MASLSAYCPHCNTQKVSFQIIGARLNPYNQYYQVTTQYVNGIALKAWRGIIPAAAVCPECNTPVAVNLELAGSKSSFEEVGKTAAGLASWTGSIEAYGLKLKTLWPLPPEPRVPTHLPSSVESAFLQAERAFARGDTDAAGMMYRRALETALKIAFPTGSGSLFQRITALVTNHDLPPAIGEWAHEVRIIGNEAAHDTESLSVEDMTATRNFVDAVLRYAISLPAEIALRRAETTPVEVEGATLPPQ